MLDLPKYSDYGLIAADVVGKTTTQLRNYATINKGKKDGVEEGMSVVTDAGLVGLVIGVSDHYAVLQLLLNRDTRVASKIQRSRVDGIIAWEGENFLTLKNIPKSYDVQAGDAVITSSFSSRYPSNIVIGRVTQVTEENNSLFRRIVVDPAVNFATLEQVFVVEYVADAERLLLEQQSEEGSKQRTHR